MLSLLEGIWVTAVRGANLKNLSLAVGAEDSFIQLSLVQSDGRSWGICMRQLLGQRGKVRYTVSWPTEVKEVFGPLLVMFAAA